MAAAETSTINPSLVYRLDRLLHRSDSSRVYAAYSRASQQSVALKLVSADGAAWTEIGALRQLSAAANVVRLLATYVLEGVFGVASAMRAALVSCFGVLGLALHFPIAFGIQFVPFFFVCPFFFFQITSDFCFRLLLGSLSWTASQGHVWLALELGVTSIARVLAVRALLETEVRAVLYFATRALHSLHSASIVHCDVKCGNLLIFDDGAVKLSDFGSAVRPGHDMGGSSLSREASANSVTSSLSSLSSHIDSDRSDRDFLSASPHFAGIDLRASRERDLVSPTLSARSDRDRASRDRDLVSPTLSARSDRDTSPSPRERVPVRSAPLSHRARLDPIIESSSESRLSKDRSKQDDDSKYARRGSERSDRRRLSNLAPETVASAAAAASPQAQSTVHFAAPELLEALTSSGSSYKPPQAAVDVWSLGITAIELVDGVPPLADVAPQVALKMIIAAAAPPLPSGKCSAAVTAFVQRCLRRNATERPSISHLVLDPLILLTTDAAMEVLKPIAVDVKARIGADAPSSGVDFDSDNSSDSDGDSVGGDGSSASASTSESSLSSASSSNVGGGSSTTSVRKVTATPLGVSPLASRKPAPVTRTISTPSLQQSGSVPASQTLVELATNMRAPVADGGIERKRRFLKLVAYEDSFSGQQAVDWVCAHSAFKTRRAAIDVLQMLQYRGVLRHVSLSACVRDTPQELYELVDRAHDAPVAELRRLIIHMFTDENSLPLKDARVRLRLVRNCVSGQTLVRWLQRTMQATVSDAVDLARARHIAQQLLSIGILVPSDHDPAAPEALFADRPSALYCVSGSVTQLLKIVESQPQLTVPFADLGGDVVRDLLTRMRSTIGGVPLAQKSDRRSPGVISSRDVITWLTGNEPRVIGSRGVAQALARELALRGAFFDVASKSTLVTDCAQQFLSFCEAPPTLASISSAAATTSAKGVFVSTNTAREVLQRATLQLTAGALLRREFENGDGVVDAHVDALCDIVQSKPAGSIDAEAARDPSIVVSAARALLALCFGFVAADDPPPAGSSDSARFVAEIAALLYDSPEHTDMAEETLSSSSASGATVDDVRDSRGRLLGRRRARLYKSGAFNALVQLAMSRDIVVHRELQPSSYSVPAEAVAKGATAAVFRGEFGSGKMRVAVKRFCEGDAPLGNPDEFMRELVLLALVRHRHLVQFLGARTRAPEQCLLFRYYGGGSLETRVHDSSFPMPWKLRVDWAASVAEALAFLHSLGIIYRDVKCSNVLLDEKLVAYLCDFGCARLVPRQTASLTRMVGTTPFMAPELFAKQPYDKRADVYSFGVFMAELGARAEPFAKTPLWDIPERVMRGERPTLPPKSAPVSYTHLLEDCWAQDREVRPTMARVARSLRDMHRELLLTSDAQAPRFSLRSFGEDNRRKSMGGFDLDSPSSSRRRGRVASGEPDALAANVKPISDAAVRSRVRVRRRRSERLSDAESGSSSSSSSSSSSDDEIGSIDGGVRAPKPLSAPAPASASLTLPPLRLVSFDNAVEVARSSGTVQHEKLHESPSPQLRERQPARLSVSPQQRFKSPLERRTSERQESPEQRALFQSAEERLASSTERLPDTAVSLVTHGQRRTSVVSFDESLTVVEPAPSASGGRFKVSWDDVPAVEKRENAPLASSSSARLDDDVQTAITVVSKYRTPLSVESRACLVPNDWFSSDLLRHLVNEVWRDKTDGDADGYVVLVGDSETSEPIGSLHESSLPVADVVRDLCEVNVVPLFVLFGNDPASESTESRSGSGSQASSPAVVRRRKQRSSKLEPQQHQATQPNDRIIVAVDAQKAPVGVPFEVYFRVDGLALAELTAMLFAAGPPREMRECALKGCGVGSTACVTVLLPRSGTYSLSLFFNQEPVDGAFVQLIAAVKSTKTKKKKLGFTVTQ
jgi:serine/threonine protein kinase